MISADWAPLVHGLLEALALMTGFAYYRRLRAREGAPSVVTGPEFAVAAGCLVGAALGNKLVFWIEMPHLLPLYWNQPAAWLGGQSMVGGLLGGLVGVEIAKRLVGVTRSTGDAFVFPVLLGLMIGRVGCFLAGLADGTYGLPTDLPWGVDFGDGISRHPTQLYEIGFAAGLWLVLRRAQPRLAARPGLLFKAMLAAYLAWRLGIDALKPVPFAYPLGLSGIQWTCLAALVLYLPPAWRQARSLP